MPYCSFIVHAWIRAASTIPQNIFCSSGRKKVLCLEQQNGEIERVYQTYYRAIILPLVERGTSSYMFFLYHSVLYYYILLNDVQQFGQY